MNGDLVARPAKLKDLKGEVAEHVGKDEGILQNS